MGCSDKDRVTINLINKIFEAGSKSMDKNEWRTPCDLYEHYDYFYKFDWDLAATVDNAKAPKFFTKLDNALSAQWPRSVNCWLNPPYGPRNEINKWVGKAIDEVLGTRDDGNWLRVVMLLPSRTDTQWFKRLWVLHKGNDFCYVDIEFLTGRVKFRREDGSIGSKPKEGSIVVTIFSDGRLQSSL